MPTGEYGSNGGYVLDGQGTMQHHPQELPQADFSLSSPGYFSTMGIPRVRGRDFTDADRYGSDPVVIISEALARQSFPNEDPIGHRLQCGLDAESMKWMTIVGVVGNVRQDSPASTASPAMYMPLAQHPYRANEVQVAIRTEVDPSSLIAPVKRIVEQMNPEVATKFTTMDAMVGRVGRRLALPDDAGDVVRRARAPAGDHGCVRRDELRDRPAHQRIRDSSRAGSARPAPFCGSCCAERRGWPRSASSPAPCWRLPPAARSRRMLFGLKSTDTLTYAIVVAVVLPAVLLAAVLPALRASRVDPLVALRHQ